ncbi:tRNA (adenosine(37)-N6)-dimethylallyltransferase MiaA [Bacillus timonensis]|nr:tRNA (adenosine(37)-N6)-dimethylallyltransferase MiaA [Bacillus timonensis]
MAETKSDLIVLIGPTAVGKTKLSIDLAKKLNAEIISGDSMQIYKGMDIGTAKISKEEMGGIAHHLIDIKDPTESFSVAEFQSIVRKKIEEIQNRGKVPMIVGGTGLYIQSVIYDYEFTPTVSDNDYRLLLEKRVSQYGIDLIYDELKRIDPESAEKIHPNNTRRVIRALEIYKTTGITMSEYIKQQEHTLLYHCTMIGLTMSRELLYKRINERVDKMIEEGLLDEVSKLYHQGVKDCQSIQAIGYKELYQYFDKNITLEQAIEQLKQNSRRYAKRQLTWFRNKMDINWFDMTEQQLYIEKFNEIYQYIAGNLRH